MGDKKERGIHERRERGGIDKAYGKGVLRG